MNEPMPWQPRENVILTKLDDGEAVLLHLETMKYYALNETGLYLWEQVLAGKSLDEMAAALEAAYRTDRAHALRSAGTFLEALRREELVHETHAGEMKGRRGRE